MSYKIVTAVLGVFVVANQSGILRSNKKASTLVLADSPKAIDEVNLKEGFQDIDINSNYFLNKNKNIKKYVKPIDLKTSSFDSLNVFSGNKKIIRRFNCLVHRMGQQKSLTNANAGCLVHPKSTLYGISPLPVLSPFAHKTLSLASHRALSKLDFLTSAPSAPALSEPTNSIPVSSKLAILKPALSEPTISAAPLLTSPLPAQVFSTLTPPTSAILETTPSTSVVLTQELSTSSILAPAFSELGFSTPAPILVLPAAALPTPTPPVLVFPKYGDSGPAQTFLVPVIPAPVLATPILPTKLRIILSTLALRTAEPPPIQPALSPPMLPAAIAYPTPINEDTQKPDVNIPLLRLPKTESENFCTCQRVVIKPTILQRTSNSATSIPYAPLAQPSVSLTPTSQWLAAVQALLELSDIKPVYA